MYSRDAVLVALALGTQVLPMMLMRPTLPSGDGAQRGAGLLT